MCAVFAGTRRGDAAAAYQQDEIFCSRGGTCRSITFFDYDTRSSHARVVVHDALEQSIAIADRLDPGGERYGPNWPFAATSMLLPCPRGLIAQSSRLRGSRFEAELSQATHFILDVANRCSFYNARLPTTGSVVLSQVVQSSLAYCIFSYLSSYRLQPVTPRCTCKAGKHVPAHDLGAPIFCHHELLPLPPCCWIQAYRQGYATLASQLAPTQVPTRHLLRCGMPRPAHNTSAQTTRAPFSPPARCGYVPQPSNCHQRHDLLVMDDSVLLLLQPKFGYGIRETVL
jgi:hypothetical protein